jgi:amidohydrolase
VLGVQTIVSRQVDLTAAPAIISFGSIHGGVRGNIIPDSVELIGSIRSLDPEMRSTIHSKIKTTAAHIAESSGASAEVEIYRGAPVTMNDTGLTERMLPVLKNALGDKNVIISPPITGSEDFAFYAQKIPAMFFFLGVNPPNADPAKLSPPHSPYFCADEKSIIVGIMAIANLAATYLEQN